MADCPCYALVKATPVGGEVSTACAGPRSPGGWLLVGKIGGGRKHLSPPGEKGNCRSSGLFRIMFFYSNGQVQVLPQPKKCSWTLGILRYVVDDKTSKVVYRTPLMHGP